MRVSARRRTGRAVWTIGVLTLLPSLRFFQQWNWSRPGIRRRYSVGLRVPPRAGREATRLFVGNGRRALETRNGSGSRELLGRAAESDPSKGG